MARDLDFFPTYDPLVRDDVYLSASWANFMATFIESLQEYLGSFGIVVPNITVAEKATIQSPREGQMIYLLDANTPTLPRTAQLQIWQVVAGVGQWTMIV